MLQYNTHQLTNTTKKTYAKPLEANNCATQHRQRYAKKLNTSS